MLDINSVIEINPKQHSNKFSIKRYLQKVDRVYTKMHVLKN